jgi:hypothetical protein
MARQLSAVMATSDVLRKQLIETAMANGTGGAADTAILLWQPLASELIAIIGEGGFNTLYARSIYLTQAAFPWLGAGDGSQVAVFRLTDLKNSFDGQSDNEANQASQMLLLTFTDILASLIGESLTAGILSSAWGNSALDKDDVGKESP